MKTTMTIEGGLRDLIADVVREEVKRALADVMRPDEYLSTRRAAAFAEVAPGTVRRWIREGRLVGHKAGRVVRVKRSDLEDMLKVGSRPHANDATPEEMARRDFG